MKKKTIKGKVRNKFKLGEKVRLFTGSKVKLVKVKKLLTITRYGRTIYEVVSATGSRAYKVFGMQLRRVHHDG